MIHIVGAGCGAPDLITLRGKKHLEEADIIIYAGSLVNPALLDFAKADCAVFDSAKMTLEEVLAVIEQAEAQGKTTVRLHTGDPSLYGAIGEQMREFDKRGFCYDITPGVSAFSGAAASLGAEYTLPDVTQTLIITRVAGKTPVPEKERLRLLAAHGTSLALYLSTGLLAEVTQELLAAGLSEHTPAAIVYKATWDEEIICRCTVGTLEQSAKEHHITKTALITLGDFLDSAFSRSRLYAPDFETEFRKANHETH